MMLGFALSPLTLSGATRGPGLTAQVQAIFANYPLSGGAMYDFLSPATLFQDAAGTVPVTAAGQPIGYGTDLSGRGKHFIPGSAGARPSWNLLADFDGVNHWGTVDLTGVTMPNGPIFIGVRMNYVSGVGFAGVNALAQSPNAANVSVSARVRMTYGNGVIVETSAGSTAGLHTSVIQATGGAASGFAVIDGVELPLVNPGSGSSLAQARYLTIGAQTDTGGNRANIDVSRVFMLNAELAPHERALVAGWLGGVS